jgi:hypothetical protein
MLFKGQHLNMSGREKKYVPYFIHPPNPAPLKITGSPLASITFSPWTLKNPLAILSVAKANLESGKSGIPFQRDKLKLYYSSDLVLSTRKDVNYHTKSNTSPASIAAL